MKRSLSLLAMNLVLVMLLTACGGNGGTETPEVETAAEPAVEQTDTAEKKEETETAAQPVAGTSDETLVVLIDAEPTHLMSTYTMFNRAGAHVAFTIYDTLISYNYDTHEYEPAVAASWEWLDETHLQFNLRDDVVAANGTPFTADDVLYTCELGVNGGSQSYWNMIDLEGCEVVDDYTFIMATKEAYPTLEMLASVHGMDCLMSRSAVEAAGGEEAARHNAKIGTGQYTFVEWVDGDHILVERNEDYWGELGYWKNIEFRFVSDAAARAMAVQSGEADVALSLSRSETISLDADPNVTVLKSWGDASKTLWMNCSEGPLSDERVREAILCLIDQEAFIQVVTGGDGVATWTNFSPAGYYYKEPYEGYERKVDVERAKELLAEAGYADGLTLNIFDNATGQTFCELLQNQLAAANIKLEIEIVEVASGMSRMNSGDYELYSGAAYGYDPVRLLNRVDGRISTDVAGGGAQYNNDELNAIIDIARYDPDPDARLQAYHDVQDFILEHTICIGMFQDVSYNACRAGLTGETYTNDGYLFVNSLRPEA